MKKEPLDQEAEIIRKCLQGDRKAQFVLYHRYARTMLNVAYRILKEEEEAKDVLQMAFIKAFDQLGNLQEVEKFAGWFKRIVVNTSIKQLKKRGMHWLQWSDELKAIPENETLEIDQSFSIDQAKKTLLRLPTGYRTVLSLYLIEGYDHQEIASILGISVQTSLSQYSRGKNKLRKLLATNKMIDPR